MINLRIIILITTSVLFSCKSEKNKPVDLDANLSWPRIQDSVGSIFNHYESVLPLNLETAKKRYSVLSNGEWGVVDEENGLYFALDYDTIISSKSRIALKKYSEYKIFDKDRKLLGSVKSDNLQVLPNGFYISERGNRKTLVDPDGILVFDHRLEDVSVPVDASYFIGKTDASWQAFDLEGRQIEDNLKALEAARWLNEYRAAFESLGPIKIGMTKEEIEEAIRWPLKELSTEQSCTIYSAGDDFLNFKLTLTGDNEKVASLERIDIYGSGINSKSGMGVGSLTSSLRKVYGDKIEVLKNDKDENSENLLLVPTQAVDKDYRLNYLSKYGRIISYSLGSLPSIQGQNACSKASF